MEVFCRPPHAGWVIATAKSFGIAAQVVGHVGTSQRKDRSNHITIKAAAQTLEYSLTD
jgi:hypothetical protein